MDGPRLQWRVLHQMFIPKPNQRRRLCPSQVSKASSYHGLVMPSYVFASTVGRLSEH